MLENMSIKMRPPAWVTFLLSIDGGLALGFIIPSFVSITALDVLVITFLPLIIAVAVNLFREGELRAPTDKIGRVIGILGLFGFFLGFGIVFGMTRADVLTTTGGEEDVLIIFLRIIFNTDNVTMTHLFLLTVTIFTVAPLLGLANDLRKSARARNVLIDMEDFIIHTFNWFFDCLFHFKRGKSYSFLKFEASAIMATSFILSFLLVALTTKRSRQPQSRHSNFTGNKPM